MKAEEVAVGAEVDWLRSEGGYGFITAYRGTIKKIGKRITIQVPLKGGGTKLVAVSHKNLRLWRNGNSFETTGTGGKPD